MDFYKDEFVIYLRISKEHIIQINFLPFDADYICTFSLKQRLKYNGIKKCDIYEVIFNDNFKEGILKNEKNIPSDILTNCMKCQFYSKCKYTQDHLKDADKTNKILKEYKEFIQNIKEFDK